MWHPMHINQISINGCLCAVMEDASSLSEKCAAFYDGQDADDLVGGKSVAD